MEKSRGGWYRVHAEANSDAAATATDNDDDDAKDIGDWYVCTNV
jgi:hypothetical protein